MKRVVLIVDDEIELRKLLAAQLKREGFTVYTAESGESAIELLKSGTHVDALVTDMRMPGGISGVELVGSLEQEGVRLPVNILMSGHAILEKDDIQKFKFDHSLSKPFSGKFLAKILIEKMDNIQFKEKARKQPRVSKEVGVAQDDRHTTTSDLSLGGVFIKMEKPLGIGSQFSVQLELEPPMVVNLEVKWLREEAVGIRSSGVGCRFVDLPSSDVERLKVYLESSLEEGSLILGG